MNQHQERRRQNMATRSTSSSPQATGTSVSPTHNTEPLISQPKASYNYIDPENMRFVCFFVRLLWFFVFIFIFFSFKIYFIEIIVPLSRPLHALDNLLKPFFNQLVDQFGFQVKNLCLFIRRHTFYF